MFRDRVVRCAAVKLGLLDIDGFDVQISASTLDHRDPQYSGDHDNSALSWVAFYGWTL